MKKPFSISESSALATSHDSSDQNPDRQRARIVQILARLLAKDWLRRSRESAKIQKDEPDTKDLSR